MKDPPSFSRLVDLRPVEPSRGPSLVKVNTNSRQCVSRSYPYFPLSLSLNLYTYTCIPLSLSLSPVHKSTQSPPSFFISKLRLSSSLYPSPLSPHLEQATRSSSSPLHRLNFFSLPRLPTERRIIPSSLIPYASNSYGTFDSSPSPSSPPDIVSVAVKLTRDQ